MESTAAGCALVGYVSYKCITPFLLLQLLLLTAATVVSNFTTVATVDTVLWTCFILLL